MSKIKLTRKPLTTDSLVDLISLDYNPNLDEMVCDHFGERASIVNNRGPKEQIEFLLAVGYSVSEIREEILMGENRD